ncbi:MAG: MJ1255/VC2487 family glycosyltransferase [Candidatus Neomarinimicrobiota bacterium]|nr:MJ1255/VC2487 family glycosyltransferase [Candidatus Neomarinimicrobiota bacterium]
MNIVYGIQGTGNGHLTRGLALIPKLRSLGNNVRVIISGRKKDKIFGLEQIEPYEIVEGLSFETSNGRINYLQSFKSLHLFKYLNDVRKLNLEDVDLVITDFEPVSAWAAKIKKVQSIGIGHQYAFYYDIPIAGENIITKFIMKNFAPAKINLGVHWHHFNQAIVPPILPPLDNNDNQSIPGKILVYLPFEELDDILQLVEPFNDYQFHIYCKIDKSRSYKNIHLNPFSRSSFNSDLLTSEKVICNAGFELPSEALRLGKKILMKPLIGQMEQLSNAAAINQLKWGSVMDKLDQDIVKEWISEPSIKSVNYPDTAKAVAKWINSKTYKGIDKLSSRLWEETSQKLF